MFAKQTATIPDRTTLRTLYDQAIAEINKRRSSDLLTTSFYAKTGDALFDVGCLALNDAITDTRRMHAVSAPAGGGKTSFSFAFLTALTNYASGHPDAPYGAAFVVDQIEKADKAFRELSALLPGKVAIWTSDHDTNCKEPERIKAPAARFTQAELRHFPVIVVTNKFYLGTKGHHARTVVRDGYNNPRALTLVDEKPDEAPAIDIALSEAQAAREAVIETNPEAKEHLDALLSFMELFHYEASNKLFRPGIEVDNNVVSESLGWFRTKEAAAVARSAVNLPSVEKLFRFAKALAIGCACVATSGALPYFFGYEEQRVVDLTAGTILLDATADIDGISSIVPWRVAIDTPRATYENLEIVHVPQHTKARLNQYLKTAANQRAYVQWVVDTIKQNMQPGELGLVVCKKSLFDAERVPTWPEGDPRFKEPKHYAEDYQWNIEGRWLCATHWGTGVGSNAWKDADVVFLFDEFFIPKRIAVATTQGLRSHRANEGDLGAMLTLNSKAKGVDSIAEGHSLRWTKQLALRGRARTYDANGVCGKQRLVVGSDLKRFMRSAPQLFPGAKITTPGLVSDDTPWATKVLDVLNKTKDRVLSTKTLSALIGTPWRKVSPDVLTSEFRSTIGAHGWQYVSRRGKLGATFERTPTLALSA